MPEKVGGPKSAFTTVWPKKWEGPGPPGPLGDNSPDLRNNYSKYSITRRLLLLESLATGRGVACASTLWLSETVLIIQGPPYLSNQYNFNHIKSYLVLQKML